MSTPEQIQRLASRSMSVRKENPGTVLSVEWADNEDQGMILYLCPTFVQDPTALLNSLQLRYQFKPNHEVKSFMYNLLSFRLSANSPAALPADLVRGVSLVLGQSVGCGEILSACVTGYPQRQFYLSRGKILTSTTQGIVGVLHIRVTATVFPPQIQGIEMVGVKVNTEGKRQFVQVSDDCSQTLPIPQVQQL